MSAKFAAFAAWSVVIAFFGGLGGYFIVPQLLYLHDLSNSNRVTQGELIETYPQMHSTCKYRYSVDGRIYEQAGRSCGNDHVGQQIRVYFSPSDSGKSSNHNPTELLVNDLIPFGLALVLFPIFAALIAYGGVRHTLSG
jgi:hypothetical protein